MNDGGAAGCLVLVCGMVLYFVPAWVANSRKHRNENSILAVNILLGWTLIGWVVALAWALASPSGSPQASLAPRDEVACPSCAELVLSRAKLCRYCGSILLVAP